MPKYTYQCRPDHEGCGTYFEFECLMSELEKAEPKVCPKCKKKKSIKPVFSAPEAHIPKTLGSLAERNTREKSKDERADMHEKHNAYRKKGPNWETGPDGTMRRRQNAIYTP